jgi:hypothetical protein
MKNLSFQENDIITSQLIILSSALNLPPQNLSLSFSSSSSCFPFGPFARVYIEEDPPTEPIYYLEGIGDLFPLHSISSISPTLRIRKEILENNCFSFSQSLFNKTSNDKINFPFNMELPSCLMSSSASILLLPGFFSLLLPLKSSSPCSPSSPLQSLIHSTLFSSDFQWKIGLLPRIDCLEILHGFGINFRFAREIEKKTKNWEIKIKIKGEIIARSIKRIFRRKLVEFMEREYKRFEIKGKINFIHFRFI